MKLAAQLGDEGVIDWLVAFFGRDEMALGHVGCVLRSVDEHVIPRLVFRRTRPSHRLIPLVGALKRRVDIKDHAPIVESLVMDDLPHEELCRVLHRIRVTESGPALLPKRPLTGIGRPHRHRHSRQPRGLQHIEANAIGQAGEESNNDETGDDVRGVP